MIGHRLFTICLLLVNTSGVLLAKEEKIPRLEAYITAEQVEQYFSTAESRQKALQVYQNIGISKVFLESLRSGYQTNLALLKEVRDFLRNQGIEVSGGITTAAGNDFGVPSSSNSYWLNYQHPKTQTDLANHLRRVAPLFDEIIVDDFFATDDESPISVQAKGDRAWPEYRLQLMADVAERCIIKPAKEANPNIRLIEKFPQWYDRFQIFGYNAVAGPRSFERIWVGTETRNPNTPRFGYVMPTEGYVNYRWLSSIAQEKIGGGWFDFGDCAPGPYLMQAYQTALAGAKEILLFETGRLIEPNECIEPFLTRRDALFALGRILTHRAPQGMYAYKPPNSNGSGANGAANLYIFDYLATLGLAPLPTAAVPEDAKIVFLARQAADDPEIAAKLKAWLKKGVKIIVTPDFLASVNDSSIPKIQDRASLPLFSSKQIDSGVIGILNLETFRQEEFAPDREMFLPPRPLAVSQWTEKEVNPIRSEVLSLWGIALDAPNLVGVCLFDGDLLVLANFNDSPAHCIIHNTLDKNSPFQPHAEFPHVSETKFEINADECAATVAPWEIAVLKR
jgi:hypothetical protein